MSELQFKEHAGVTTLTTSDSASEKYSLRAIIDSHMSGPLYTFMDYAVKCELIIDALTGKAFMGGEIF